VEFAEKIPTGTYKINTEKSLSKKIFFHIQPALN
jgi:hypothetical protein